MVAFSEERSVKEGEESTIRRRKRDDPDLDKTNISPKDVAASFDNNSQADVLAFQDGRGGGVEGRKTERMMRSRLDSVSNTIAARFVDFELASVTWVSSKSKKWRGIVEGGMSATNWKPMAEGNGTAADRRR